MTEEKNIIKKRVDIPAVQPSKTNQPPFSPMLQGPGSNKLSQITTRTTMPSVDDKTGIATITDGEHSVFIERYNELAGGLRISTHKLLDACTMALTSRNQYRGSGAIETSVIIPLKEYVSMLGKPTTKASIDETRKRVKEDLETLYSISIEWKERNGRNVKDYAKMRIVTMQGIRSGNIIVGFSPEFAKYLIGAYLMHYPKALLKIDERNPNSYHIGRKLLLHHSIDNNRKKGTANIISVRALLEECQDIPGYGEVVNGDRAIERRIKKPFIDALDDIEALGILTYHFSNSKNAPLSKKQLDSIKYADFISLYVYFTVKDFPDQTARQQANAEKIEKATAKKKASKKEEATP